jgi:two-component system sensor kinase FixL
MGEILLSGVCARHSRLCVASCGKCVSCGFRKAGILNPMLSSQLQAVMDAAVDAVILIDHAGRIGAFNRSAERLFGYTAAELQGRNVSVLMPEPHRSSHDAYLARYAATGIAHIIGVGRDVEALRKDGTVFPAHLSVGQVAGAEPPQFVGFVRDTTAERQAIATIQSERDLARAYLTLGHTVLLTLDATGRVQFINPTGCEELGLTESQLLERPWTEALFAPPERARASAELVKAVALPPRTTHSCELLVQTAAGRARHFTWRFLTLRDDADNVTAVLGSGEDITERRHREEEALRSTGRLVHVSRLATMGEMAAGIAHELNQPLTAIANYARACERFIALPEPDLPEIRDASREISAEAMRAADIIRRLRQLVRKEDGERVPSDLNAIVEELRVLTQADARAHDTRLSFDLEPDLPMVVVDRVQITQVLLNLVRNALEALSGEPAGKRQITLSTRRAEHGDVEANVCDNGSGVDPRILDRLFDPFSTTKANGTGLGLPMSRTIIQAHGGTVTYIPVQPRGACFRVTLPSGDNP